MRAFLAWMGVCSLSLVAAAPAGHAACDADGRCVIRATDFAVFRRAFHCVAGDPCYEPSVDLDSDGVVAAQDFLYFKALLGAAEPDVTPPAVSITSPIPNRVLSGAVTLIVLATDDVAVRAVTVFFEGIDPNPLQYTAPYQTTLDTRTIPNGEHVIRADAYDFAGNVASHRVSVRIDNPLPAPAGSPPELVIVDDLNGDGRYTGEDLKIGLARCAPGCTLRALARTYDDVEIVIPAQITDALIIEGAGMGQTVFRSPVPWARPVFTVSYPNPHVTFRDLSIDGRKGDQTSAFVRTRAQTGLEVSNPWAADSGPGIIERIEVRNMLNAGIGIRGGTRWIVRDSIIHDNGCSDRFPCPNLAIIDPRAALGDAKWQSIGYGIVIESSDNAVYENQVWNINKIGIEAYEDPAGVPQGSAPISGFHFHHNHVHHCGGGIGSNGVSGGLIESNVVRYSGAHGVFCGASAGDLVFNDNWISDNDYFGLWVSCWGANITVTNNQIGNNCRKLPGGGSGLQVDARTLSEDANGITIQDNFVSEPYCQSASLIAHWNDVEISGNEFRGGNALGTLFFQDVTNVLMGDTRIDGENGVPAAIFLLSSVDRLTVGGDVRMTGYTQQPLSIAYPATVTNVVVE
jgi:hypothetical protein